MLRRCASTRVARCVWPCGLRLGELIALTWARFELAGDRPALVIAASWKTSTKTGRVRRILLLEPARDALERWRPREQDRAGRSSRRQAAGSTRRATRSAGTAVTTEPRTEPPSAGPGCRSAQRSTATCVSTTCGTRAPPASSPGSWGRAWRLEEVRYFLGHSDQTTQLYAHLAPDALHARATAIGGTRQPGTNPTRLRSPATRNFPESLARPERFELPTFGSEDRGERSDRADLDGGVSASCRVTAADAARALLGTVARGEAVPVAVLEQFARTVLEGEAIVRLAMRVLDEGKGRRLARAIELAGAVLDSGAAVETLSATCTHRAIVNAEIGGW
jgi:hypothetical protein